MTFFDFTPVDIANVKNTPRQTPNLIRAKLCALFLDDRDINNLIECSVNMLQGLLFKAVNNPAQAVSDPILIQNFPDPNNPNNLHPGILNLFLIWNSARLAQEFHKGIQ